MRNHHDTNEKNTETKTKAPSTTRIMNHRLCLRSWCCFVGTPEMVGILIAALLSVSFVVTGELVVVPVVGRKAGSCCTRVVVVGFTVVPEAV